MQHFNFIRSFNGNRHGDGRKLRKGGRTLGSVARQPAAADADDIPAARQPAVTRQPSVARQPDHPAPAVAAATLSVSDKPPRPVAGWNKFYIFLLLLILTNLFCFYYYADSQLVKILSENLLILSKQFCPNNLSCKSNVHDEHL